MRYPIPPDSVKRLVCSTHVPSTKLSHYYVELGNNPIEVAHAPLYSLINDSRNNNTNVYPLNIGSVGGITKQKMIASLPRFQLEEPDKLVDKIKLYILFS